MPTNITYKNSTLTTITNGQSKILKTIGKYMEDDLIVTNMANNQSLSITLTPTTYQQIQNITPGNAYEGLSAVTVAVNPIPSSYIIPSGTINIANNTTGIDITNYANAVVNVSPSLTTASVTPSETAQNITPGAGYDGLSSVTVNGITNTYVGSSVPRRTNEDSNFTVQSRTYSSEGKFKEVITAPAGYYATTTTKQIVNITVENISGIPTQSETTIIPSETTQTAVDIHKWTTGTVTVAAITPTYVGSSVPAGSLTISGPTVTASAGYYANAVTETIPDAIPTTITVNLNLNDPRVLRISNSGLITFQAGYSSGSASYYPYINGSAGYVKTNSPISISVADQTNTYQLPTLPAQSFTPSSSTQTVTSTGKYMTGDITVQPIPSQYIVPSGTLTITSVDTTTTFDATSYASVNVNLKNADVTAY